MKRDVTFNTGSTINGTIQKENLAIADNNPDYTNGDWVAGINNDDGYVIVGDTISLNLVGRPTGGGTSFALPEKPTFWKSAELTDAALLALINRLPGSPGNFINIASARGWVDSSTYMITNDYDSISTDLVFMLAGGGFGGPGFLGTESWGGTPDYRPALYPGELILPNHTANDSENDFDLLSGPGVSIYFNTKNYYGVSVSATLSTLLNTQKTLTFTQGTKIAILQTDMSGFSFQTVLNPLYDNIEVVNYFINNPLTIIQSAGEPFTYGELVYVTIS